MRWPLVWQNGRHDHSHKRTARETSLFRVQAPVARRPPHRPGREDFLHPVPRSYNISVVRTSQATPRLAHNCCYSSLRYHALFAVWAAEICVEEIQTTPPYADFVCLANSAMPSVCAHTPLLSLCSYFAHHNTGSNRAVSL